MNADHLARGIPGNRDRGPIGALVTLESLCFPASGRYLDGGPRAAFGLELPVDAGFYSREPFDVIGVIIKTAGWGLPDRNPVLNFAL